MRKVLLTIALLVSTVVVEAEQKPGTLEERVDRLERVMRNQSLSDIVLQVQRLQQEVKQLRGELELQSHAVDALNQRQRDFYLDMDRRLGQSGGAVAPPAVPPSASAPEAAPAVSAVTPAPVGPTTLPPVSGGGDPAKEQAAYQQAFDLLKQGKYGESITAFRGFLQAFPAGNYSDNAQYWLGEASYVSRDFDTALADFTRVLERYPASAKTPGAMLKIGYIHMERNDKAKAKDVLTQLAARFPGSTEARLAEQRLEKLR